jgi:ABC-2 type transport system ATP-binding protein
MSIYLRELSVRYGSIVAVDRVTAEFPTGAVGLLGRNGAGKSSILKSLLGLVRPSGGEMSILDLPQDVPAVEVRRQVGYMPERDGYIAGLNGYETVTLAGQLTGLPKQDAARRAHEVLYLVGLEEQRYRKVSGYSAGMRQKVKLGVAMVHDPAVLFLDEPTSGLDPRGREEMLELVKYMAGDLGKSVILSTHILQDVETTCGSVVLLEKGRVIAAGSVAELTRTELRVYHMELTLGRSEADSALRRAGALEVDEGKNGRLRVTVPEGLAPSALFDAVHNAGGAVRRMQAHRRTLEEVFLGALEEESAR